MCISVEQVLLTTICHRLDTHVSSMGCTSAGEVLMKVISLSTLGVAITLAAITACGSQLNQASESGTESLDAVSAPAGVSASDMLKKNRFHLITPTGEKIFAAMKAWESGQVAEAKYYAQPAMCATNASRVLEMAGIKSYSSPLLMTMVNAVRKRGGLVMEL
ncbi:MAG: hypothetical protein RI932_196, partial [Pseudomonadota bacterium]